MSRGEATGRLQVLCQQLHPVPTAAAAVPADSSPPVPKQDKESITYPDVPVTHPLDPLCPKEIDAVRQIVSNHAGFKVVFETIDLLDPLKEEVRSWLPGRPFSRKAHVIAFQRNQWGCYLAEVDLKEHKLVKWEFDAKYRPMIHKYDINGLFKALTSNDVLRSALAKRGFDTSGKDVQWFSQNFHVEPWPACNYPGDDAENKSLLNAFLWQKFEPEDNHYAHPIEGINVLYDRINEKVVEVQDHEVIPVPQIRSNYHHSYNQDTFGSYKFKPLEIIQPEGASFTVNNRVITWHKWSVHIGWRRREGLVLSDVSYDGRPLLYEASIAEMVVPYASPHNAHHRKSVFDIGEAGFGMNANSLKRGCDCKGHIHYMDAWMNVNSGAPHHIENAICIHEEDHSVLWKHTDSAGHVEVRRARRLVVSTIHTVGNYEYGCYWYFMMDGGIEFEMKATGIINTVGVVPGKGQGTHGNKFGVEVSPGVFGMHHQHLFTAKLDWAVDGDANAVVECDTLQDPYGSKDNPYGNAWYVKETLLESELKAGRKTNADTLRFWKFINPNKLNAMGKPTGYKLEPTMAVKSMVIPNSPNGQRQLTYVNDLWVTAYDRKQRYPCGEVVHQSDASHDGLAKWVKADRPLVSKDIVAWYNFGLHHITRLEDYPVQPVTTTGFKVHPVGFFDRNPCLDVPPTCHDEGRDV